MITINFFEVFSAKNAHNITYFKMISSISAATHCQRLNQGNYHNMANNNEIRMTQ